ncbi:MAG: hypothetical protein WAS36_03170 [Candidatus Saccharimonadales bacterium]
MPPILTLELEEKDDELDETFTFKELELLLEASPSLDVETSKVVWPSALCSVRCTEPFSGTGTVSPLTVTCTELLDESDVEFVLVRAPEAESWLAGVGVSMCGVAVSTWTRVVDCCEEEVDFMSLFLSEAAFELVKARTISAKQIPSAIINAVTPIGRDHQEWWLFDMSDKECI